MRQFIYKTIIVVFAIALLFEFTVGKRLDPLVNSINKISDKQGRKEMVNKLRKEMNKSLERENILNKDDRILLKRFINKLQLELNSADN